MTDTPLVQPEAGSNDPIWIRRHTERIAAGLNTAIRNLNTLSDTVDGLGGGSSTLSGLTDVTITAVATGEVLYKSAGNWINGTLSEAGIAAASHNHAASNITSGTFDDARVAESNVTQHEGAIDHDALTNFVANEHIDWTADQGATNIDDGNITETAVTQHESAIDHDALTNFVADEHIAHSGVSITAGAGLTGGGTIAASRTINIGAGTGITVAADSISVDASAVDHDSLSGFVADEHVAHSGVSITAGAGLTGGGTIASSRTLNVGAGTGISVAADSVSTNDSEIVHDNLSGFVANEHINHAGVTLTAGNGLTGGGTIAASRSFAVGAGTGISVGADTVAVDFTAVQAKDDLLDDISGMSDPGADRMMFWDDSAGTMGWLTAGTDLTFSASTLEFIGSSGGGGYTFASRQSMTSSQVEFTSLPSGINLIVFGLYNSSLSGGNEHRIILGDSGGYETTGYQSAEWFGGSGIQIHTTTSGYQIHSDSSSDEVDTIGWLMRVTGNTWVLWGGGMPNSGQYTFYSGRKTLTGELTQIRFESSSGNTFDSGSVILGYQ